MGVTRQLEPLRGRDGSIVESSVDVRRLIDALQSPASEEEILLGHQLVAKASAACRTGGRRGLVGRVLTGKGVALASTAVVLALGGGVAAAATGQLPGSAQSFAHKVLSDVGVSVPAARVSSLAPARGQVAATTSGTSPVSSHAVPTPGTTGNVHLPGSGGVTVSSSPTEVSIGARAGSAPGSPGGAVTMSPTGGSFTAGGGPVTGSASTGPNGSSASMTVGSGSNAQHFTARMPAPSSFLNFFKHLWPPF
jgi:hypothetical protein